MDGPFGAKHGEGCGGSQGVDPRPSRGGAKLVDSCGVTRGVRDFSRQGLEYARYLGVKGGGPDQA